MPELDPIKLHLQGFNYSGGWSDGAVIRKTYVGELLASEVGEAVLTAAAAADARAAIQAQQVFDVKAYGAVGDGVADDTAEIHLARDAAGVGGRVFFPAGTYLVEDLVASVADQVWELHPGATIKMKSTANEVVKIAANGVTLEGGTFDASNGTLHDWSQHGIYFENVSGLTFRNITVANSPKHGIRGLNSEKITVTGSTFLENYDGAVFLQNTQAAPSNLSDFLIVNNWVESASLRGGGFVVRGEATDRTVSRVTMTGNTVIATPTPSTVDPACIGIIFGNECVVDGNTLIGANFGITFAGPYRSTISNNVVKGFKTIGIEIPDSSINCSVTGNTITAADYTTDGKGIYASRGAMTGLTITGNTISGFTVGPCYGISLSSLAAVTNATISGNTITSTVSSGQFVGMQCNDVVTNMTITGNVIDCGSTAPSYGLNFLGNTTGLVVTGNQFSNIASMVVNLSTSAGATFSDVRVSGNIVRNCGLALGGSGASTAGTNILTDNAPALTSTATAAGTTTLSVDSREVQVFTGSTTQTCVLPTTATIGGLSHPVGVGRRWTIINESTGAVTVNASGGATVAVLGTGGSAVFTALQAAPTTAAHWSYSLANLGTPKMSGVKDTSGNTILGINPLASAVNYLQVTNNIAGQSPILDAAGSDANLNIHLRPKGTGGVNITNSASTIIARFNRVGSAVNYWDFEQSATGQPIKVYPSGSDSNISVNIVPKGTGTLQVNANPVGVKVAVPANATAAGVPGQWAADSSWIYVCTAANTWVRAALATW